MRSDLAELVDKVLQSFTEFSPPWRNTMDKDFYKFTMGQLIFWFYPEVNATLELIIRDKEIPIVETISENELRMCLDYAMGVKFRGSDRYYMRGIDLYGGNMFKDNYLDHLQASTLPLYELKIRGKELTLRFPGKWLHTSPWETVALAIISELYYRSILRKVPLDQVEGIYTRADDRLQRKLEKLAKYHGIIRFSDFSQRRRHSFLWQDWVIGQCKKVMGDQFTGTSNTWMAVHHDLAPIGTNAHELPMVLTALANTDEEKRAAQYQVLRDWEKMYGQGLRISLPDTYGTEQFFNNAPHHIAAWKGFRQDSGDPITRGELYINWLKKMGVNPREKLIIFSDGLDVDEIIRLHQHFDGRINTSFGWGSLLGNDFRDCLPGNPHMRPFSMVCKVVEANGRPCVKLSDNINKATGPKDEVERYKRIFGEAGRSNEVVVV